MVNGNVKNIDEKPDLIDLIKNFLIQTGDRKGKSNNSGIGLK